jgi:hypothetical protein
LRKCQSLIRRDARKNILIGIKLEHPEKNVGPRIVQRSNGFQIDEGLLALLRCLLLRVRRISLTPAGTCGFRSTRPLQGAIEIATMEKGNPDAMICELAAMSEQAGQAA